MRSEAELIMQAAAFAAEAHIHQRRKHGDVPYINHPLRVAHAATCAGLPPEAIAAALLHDVVEDTSASFEDLAERFPERVVSLVRLLTQWWPDDAPAEIKQAGKPRYYAAIAEDPLASALKLLDRADNLADMHAMLPRAQDWARRYARRSHDEVRPLVARCDNAYACEAFEGTLSRLEAALAAQDRR